MRRRLLPLVLTVICASPSTPVLAQAEPPEPYEDPPFACRVVDYGTNPPELPAPPDDPLCVRYDKTNVTVSDLGVIDFLAAEPGRVAIVAGKCSYWQQDRWVVRLTPQSTPVVEWSGSYWYDGRSGSGAGIMRDLRVGGRPADGRAFIEALRPLVGDDAADQLARYASPGGGGGARFALPSGFGSEACPPPSGGPDSSPTSTVGDAPNRSPGMASHPRTEAASGSETALPDTGGNQPPVTWAVAVVAAVAMLYLSQRFS